MSAMPSAPTLQSLGEEADPLIGRLINDRYKVMVAIGHGGMGRVYKAMQSPLDRVVALKVLGGGHDHEPNFYKRFFLEASVTAKLTHPNTITLYDYGRTPDGIFFIAMEYLDGRTLSAAMQQEGPLTQERVIHIAQQICRSLREAHALGIIHRDLKPANVMLLQQHDDHDFVKVLDFGLVKFFHGDNPEDDITNAGTFMGSPHYIAPEQARNQNPDQRCDIYSLGVLLHHMLTGKVPFTAANPVDIILKHLHDPPPPIRTVRPDLDLHPELEAVVLKCLAKDREQRYPLMDDLLADLKVVRLHLTGTSGPHSMPPSADTLVGMRPVRPGLYAGVAGVAHTPPSLLTPSAPMQVVGAVTPDRGQPVAPRQTVPPPPPADSLEPANRPRLPGFTPAFAGVTAQRRSRALLAVPALVAALALGAWLLWPRADGDSHRQQAPIPVATAAIAAAPSAPAASADKQYETALQGTTLVSVTSTPAGATVQDADDRLLGVTPFELRVPTAKPLLLTLKHDGYKPYLVKQKVSGERMPLAASMKRDPKADSSKSLDQTGSKRSVGYKDDPY